MDRFSLFEDVLKNVEAYRDFLGERAGAVKRWEDIPITTKQNYLLRYPVEKTVREGELERCFLIGASSGFSKTGVVYWLKGSADEKAYMESVKESLKRMFRIHEKRTLTVVALAFGTWIGGMQIACHMRHLAATAEFPFTVTTPGLDLEEAALIIKRFKHIFEQVLFITNASNVSIVYSLLKDEGDLTSGRIYFPVVGEYFSEHYRREMALKFGHREDEELALWTGYGSADTGDVAVETPATIRLRKHLSFNDPSLGEELFGTKEIPMIMELSPDVFVEIVDGKIVVTKDQLIPLIRYNTMDSGTLLNKEALKGRVPHHLYQELPEVMLCVGSRVENSVVFYGTNLAIPEIDNFLWSMSERIKYSGIFEVERRKKEGIDTFHFTIYTLEEVPKMEAECQRELIGFLKERSREFAAKYDRLKKAAKTELITVELKKLTKDKASKKHRFIKE